MLYVSRFVGFLSFIFAISGCFGPSMISSKVQELVLPPGPVLQSLMNSPISINPTATLQVTNSKPGAILKIYGSQNCTNYLEDIVSNSESFSFTLQTPLTIGTYRFSARYVENGQESSCSNSLSDYYYDPDFSVVKPKATIRNAIESNGTMNIEYEMTPAKAYDVSVQVNFNGTNKAVGSSFSYASKTITFRAGETTAYLPIQLIDDGVKQIDGMIVLNVESTSTSQVRIDKSATTRIYVQDSSATYKSVTNLQMGGSSSQGGCAILNGGEVKCWGVIGGAITGFQAPTVMDSGTNYSQLSLDAGLSCGITTLGTLKCWNSYPGNGSSVSISAPYTHAGSYNFVTTNSYGTCAIRANGDLYCWGINTNGRLGNGNTTAQNSPVNIDAGSAYSSISMSGAFSCGILANQQVKCWGANASGQLGDTTTASRTLPAGVIDAGETFSKLSTSSGSTVCGITTSQKLKCWGLNNYGQVGDGTTTNVLSPTLIDGTNDYADVKVGGDWTCAITTSGVLKCWGRNHVGQLGDGTLVNKSSPIPIDGTQLYSKIFPSEYNNFTCGITATVGELKCWGSMSYGNANLGPATQVPVNISPLLTFSDLSYGYYRIGGVTTLGFVVMAGDLFNGPKNFGFDSPHIPKKQDPEKKYLMISGNCRIDIDNKLFCKGRSGDGSSTSHYNFVAVDNSKSFSKVSSNGLSVCAIATDGKLFCWGNYTGDGTTTTRYSPIEIDAGQIHIDVSVGDSATCTIRSDGQLLCWGDNSNGIIGDNTIISKYSPIPIDVGVAYDKVSLKYHACAIVKTSGILKCWGEGFRGKVGHGLTTNQLTPLEIDTGTPYKDVETIDQHTCGITIAGALKCWGRNFAKEIGDGSGINKLVPTAIDIGELYEKVGAGDYEHTCAVTTTGTIKCWGTNDQGESGQDTASTQTLFPTTVAGLPVMSKISSGSRTSCGIDTSGYIWCWGMYDFSGEYGLGFDSLGPNQLIIRNMLMEGN